MFNQLELINERPAVFAHMTVADLWTDPHVSEQMLRFHLDGTVAVSSGTTEWIEAATTWMAREFRLGGNSRVLDLGCGPGLYAIRLARTGARVTGVDFSARSIAYAREAAQKAGLPIDYVHHDYLAYEPAGRFDLVTMIMRDYCAMEPSQRLALLRTIGSALASGGAFVFDVDSTVAFANMAEEVSYSHSPRGGFWSAEAFFEFHNRFVYPDERVVLDKFVVVEANRTRTLFNWIQCFDPTMLAAELGEAGLRIDATLGNVTGAPFDPASPEFAVVARR